jgi:Protein of unknown function (DUF3499)
VDGAVTCSRLGCNEAAVALFAFDAQESLVWLDPIGTGGRGAGVLCLTHADRLSPPRGWSLLDRRGAESRLWLGEPASTTPASRKPRREPARSRPRTAAGPRLPFDSPEPTSAPPVPAAVATPAPAVAKIVTVPDAELTPWSPHDRPGVEFERVVDARTPLLARAFEAVRHTYDD